MDQCSSPPNHSSNTEAESAVIGEILNHKDSLVKAMARLVPDDFLDQERRVIFRAASELFLKSRTIDIISVHTWLREQGFKDITVSALTDYSSRAFASVLDLDPHIETVKRCAMVRGFIRACHDAEAKLLDGGDPVEVIGNALEAGSAILAAGDKAQEEHIAKVALNLGDEFDERFHNSNRLPGITSGIAKLDRLTCGWTKRQPYIHIAARPSVGKTTFALNLAFAAAMAGYKVRFHSVEMDKESIAEMAISLAGGIENLKLRTGRMAQEDFDKIAAATGDLGRMGIVIDDTPEIAVQQIRARTQRQAMDQGCDLVVIDYLQLIKGPGKYRSKYEETTEVSHQLRAMGRALRIPMIILGQLNREIEQRGGEKRVACPRLADIRESGAIEQDADIIGFLYDPNPPPEDGIRPESGPIKLYIAKNRRGLVGTVDLVFDRQFCRFKGAIG
jgi:replicative DNA helicase